MQGEPGRTLPCRPSSLPNRPHFSMHSRLFLIEAGKYSALPLNDRTFERFNAELAGRPQLIKGQTQLLLGGMGRLSENSVVSIKNKSHSVTADVDVPTSGAEGVIVAQGGSTNGWSLYAKGGKLKYCYRSETGSRSTSRRTITITLSRRTSASRSRWRGSNRSGELTSDLGGDLHPFEVSLRRGDSHCESFLAIAFARQRVRYARLKPRRQRTAHPRVSRFPSGRTPDLSQRSCP
jgi:hypothetical protein